MKKRNRKLGRKILSAALALTMCLALTPAVSAQETAPEETPAPKARSFDVLRTSINPGYYFSGILVDMGTTLEDGAVDKDTFSAKARVTEANGSVQEAKTGSFAWDPEKADYILKDTDNWAKWNILDAYVADEDGNKADKGNYVKLDIEWGTRTEPSGESDASRYDVPATRASWYTLNGYHAFASVEVDLTQEEDIAGVEKAEYEQGETRHDPLFDAFDLSLKVPGGGKAALYTPANASKDNLRPLLVWFHGTGERYTEATVDGKTVDNAGANLVGNRILAFADEEFQTTMDGAYVLAPQSTEEGWSAKRLDDMEELIRQVVAENHIDPERIYVGGLSMGTGMTTPLITSTSDKWIQFAGAMLVSGGSISEQQAKIIADKGFPVYLVGSTSDMAASGLPASYERLLTAGADASLEMFPKGPVNDGTYYYGAHDAWNYVYNNMVKDGNGQSIFQWLSKQTMPATVPFTDVKPGQWYYGAVKYVYGNKLMAGTGEATFAPNANLTRAQAAQILYNLEGTPAVTGAAPFTDAADAGNWALNAITWAAQNDVVSGDGDGIFAPNRQINREEFGQMLYNYAKFKKYDVTGEADLSKFTDAASISSWAEKSLSWANANGLINGHEDTGKIDPKGITTRAQAASMLRSFDLNLVE